MWYACVCVCVCVRRAASAAVMAHPTKPCGKFAGEGGGDMGVWVGRRDWGICGG